MAKHPEMFFNLCLLPACSRRGDQDIQNKNVLNIGWFHKARFLNYSESGGDICVKMRQLIDIIGLVESVLGNFMGLV